MASGFSFEPFPLVCEVLREYISHCHFFGGG
jgi:hypothetical protein